MEIEDTTKFDEFKNKINTFNTLIILIRLVDILIVISLCEENTAKAPSYWMAYF